MRKNRYVVGQSNFTSADAHWRWLAALSTVGTPTWTDDPYKAKRFLSEKNANQALSMVRARGIGRITDMFVISESRMMGTNPKENPASRKLYNALAGELAITLKRAAGVPGDKEFYAWCAGFDAAVATVADNLKRDNPRFDKERFFDAVYRNRPSKKNPRKNPPLVTFGNPRGEKSEYPGMECLSRDVIEIRYRHVGDRQNYRHAFARNQVQLHAIPGGKVAVLRRVDGKPLVEDY